MTLKLPAGVLVITLAERKPGESWILLVYGQSKSGKTHFAGTCGSRTLFINIGDGLETLKSPLFMQMYSDSANMLTVDIPISTPEEVFDLITRTIDYFLAERADEFDNIVLDEATALRKHATDKAIGLVSKGTRNRRKVFSQTELGDYNVEMQMIEWFLATYVPIFKEKKKNFLMLAHERQIYGKPPKMGDEAPLIKIVPGFTGKTFPDKVPAYFDDIWHSVVVGKNPLVYRLETARSEKLLVGSRHGGIFAPEEENPNYLKMLERIKNQTRYIAKPKVTPPNPNKEQKNA